MKKLALFAMISLFPDPQLMVT